MDKFRKKDFYLTFAEVRKFYSLETLYHLRGQRVTTPPKKLLQTNDWAEILSQTINCMNLKQFEEGKMRMFLVEKISTSLLTLFAKYYFSRLEMHDFLGNA